MSTITSGNRQNRATTRLCTKLYPGTLAIATTMENYVPSTTAESYPSFQQPILKRPLEPMLARPIRTFKDMDKLLFDGATSFSQKFVIQEKFDGERMLCVAWNNGPNKCFSRTLKPLSFPYKIVLREPFKSAILDGELVYTRKMPIDREGLSDLERVAICNTGDKSTLIALYVIFDVQAIDDRWVVTSLTTRQRLLLLPLLVDCENSTRNVLIAPMIQCQLSNSRELVDFLLEHTRRHSSEGLMAKLADGPYKAGRREADWFKLKVSHLRELRKTFELIVYRVLLDRNGLPSIMVCGCRDDDGQFKEIVRISSGITCETRRRLALMFNTSDGYPRDPSNDITVRFTADVSSRTTNDSFRHPVFLEFVT